MRKVLIISKEWKLRSYLKAELLERQVQSVCLEDIDDVNDGEDFVLGFIDCKGQDLSQIKKFINSTKMRLIVLDYPYPVNQVITLTRPVTIGDCVQKIEEVIK